MAGLVWGAIDAGYDVLSIDYQPMTFEQTSGLKVNVSIEMETADQALARMQAPRGYAGTWSGQQDAMIDYMLWKVKNPGLALLSQTASIRHPETFRQLFPGAQIMLEHELMFQWALEQQKKLGAP